MADKQQASVTPSRSSRTRGAVTASAKVSPKAGDVSDKDQASTTPTTASRTRRAVSAKPSPKASDVAKNLFTDAEAADEEKRDFHQTPKGRGHHRQTVSTITPTRKPVRFATSGDVSPRSRPTSSLEAAVAEASPVRSRSQRTRHEESSQPIPHTPQRTEQVQSRSGISPSKKDTQTRLPIEDERVKKLIKRAYAIIKKRRDFAYSTPDSPIYGENTEKSLSRAFHAMGLGDSSNNVFCDVGSGTGTPCIQAACEYPNLTCYGFELIAARWWLSQNILLELLNDTQSSSVARRILLAHLSLQSLTDFGPCTHVFSFDTGFPREALHAYGAALRNSRHVRVLACFQKQKTLEEAGFPQLKLKEQVSMKLIGSGESHTVFVYDVIPEQSASSSSSSGDVSSQSFGSPSWNLTGLFAPPSDKEYARSEGHHASYGQGEEARKAGTQQYREWLIQQIGLHRSSRVQTRASTRRLALGLAV